MNLRSLCAVAATAAILASCGKENNPDAGIPDGVETYMQLELTQATGSPTTRATFPDGLAGTADEKAIEEVRLYMFNSLGVLEIVEDFDTGDDSRTFRATTGSKTFIALVNMKGFYPSATPNSTTLSTFKREVADIASMVDIAKSGEFWMTSSQDVTQTLQESSEADAPTKNFVQIEVCRMVAKVGVEFAPNTQIDGILTPSTVEYKVANNPKKVMMFATRDAAGYLKTPYYDQPYNAANYFKQDDTYYRTTTVGTINAGEFDAGSVSYMIENSNLDPLQGNSTFLIVKGQFVPNDWLDEDGEPTSTPSLAGDGTFYRVLNAGDYVPGFFNDVPTATGVAKVGGDSYIEYTKGMAYYALFVNDTENNLDAKEKYVVERNTAWDVKITSVSGCGEPDEDNLPKEPTDPLDVDTYMKAEISVAPWVNRTQQGGI